MNGPSHYEEAERLLDMNTVATEALVILARAQVHADLAAVAAFVDNADNLTYSHGWNEVTR